MRMVCRLPLTQDVLLMVWTAEDFYGNDYPEDEVHSDDEFDRGAYNYRNSASDSEEFGDDEPSWSDDENRKPYS